MEVRDAYKYQLQLHECDPTALHVIRLTCLYELYHQHGVGAHVYEVVSFSLLPSAYGKSFAEKSDQPPVAFPVLVFGHSSAANDQRRSSFDALIPCRPGELSGPY